MRPIMSVNLSLHGMDMLFQKRSLQKSAKTSLLLNVWKRFENARMRKAKSEILKVLQVMDKNTLIQCGYTHEDLVAIRDGHFVRPSNER